MIRRRKLCAVIKTTFAMVQRGSQTYEQRMSLHPY